MSTTRPDNRWQQRGYAQIAAAEYDGELLHVKFGDGDTADLEPSRLLGGVGGLDWSRAKVDGPEIRVPGAHRDYAVSWLDIRAVIDDAFAAYLAQIADEEARQVGRKLRSLREARGLSGAALAARAQITPQSLSRIEHGRHDVVYSTLQRLLAAMNYSLADLQDASVEEIDLAEVARRMRRAGLSKGLVRRLVPTEARPSQVLDRLQRIFGWSSSDLSRDQPLPIRASVALAAAFKYTSAQHPELGPYVLYAHYLAGLVHQATPRPERVSLRTDAALIREEILAKSEIVDFAGLVDWAWERGVAVLPLFDPGQFHGACWLFDGRPIVVLKQITDYDARLAFDLGHEIGHVALHLSETTPAVIEVEEIVVSPEDEPEEEASDFAGEIVLGDPERLVGLVVKEAAGRGEWLKRAVEKVAPQERVAPGALANYLAWRLEGQIDWWGTAANLQRRSPKAAAHAVARLHEHLDLDRLAADDRELLLAALAPDVEP
jgi:transcriptional regulator with XRE-family HTH domain